MTEGTIFINYADGYYEAYNEKGEVEIELKPKKEEGYKIIPSANKKKIFQIDYETQELQPLSFEHPKLSKLNKRISEEQIRRCSNIYPASNTIFIEK